MSELNADVIAEMMRLLHRPDLVRDAVRMVLITRRVPDGAAWKCTYLDEQYLLMHPVFLARLQSEIKQSVSEPKPIYEQGLFGQIVGIPIVEDDELVGKIFESFLPALADGLVGKSPLIEAAEYNERLARIRKFLAEIYGTPPEFFMNHDYQLKMKKRNTTS